MKMNCKREITRVWWRWRRRRSTAVDGEKCNGDDDGKKCGGHWNGVQWGFSLECRFFKMLMIMMQWTEMGRTFGGV